MASLRKTRLPSRWVVAVSAAAATTLPGDALLYAVLPVVWQELGLELWMVGILLSVNRFVRLLTNPLAGRVVDRLGMRTPFVSAVFASSLTTACYGLHPGFALFLAARACWGLCWSFLRLGGFLAALDASDSRGRGLALGFYNGVANTGTLVAVLFGGLLTDAIGFQATAWLFAGVTLAGGVAIARERPGLADAARPAVPGAPAEASARGSSRAGRLAVQAAAFANGCVGSGLVLSTLGLWLLERFGPEVPLAGAAVGVATLNGLLLSSRFAAAVGWAPLAGHLSDRFGRVRFLGAAWLVVVGCLGVLSQGPALPGAIVTVVLLFLGGTAVRVALDAAAGDQAPPALRARAMSAYANASDLGAAIAPFLAYQLAGIVGLTRVYQGAAIVLLLAALVTPALLGRRRA